MSILPGLQMTQRKAAWLCALHVSTQQKAGHMEEESVLACRPWTTTHTGHEP